MNNQQILKPAILQPPTSSNLTITEKPKDGEHNYCAMDVTPQSKRERGQDSTPPTPSKTSKEK